MPVHKDKKIMTTAKLWFMSFGLKYWFVNSHHKLVHKNKKIMTTIELWFVSFGLKYWFALEQPPYTGA